MTGLIRTMRCLNLAESKDYSVPTNHSHSLSGLSGSTRQQLPAVQSNQFSLSQPSIFTVSHPCTSGILPLGAGLTNLQLIESEERAFISRQHARRPFDLVLQADCMLSLMDTKG
jgi:hypothetical protein